MFGDAAQLLWVGGSKNWLRFFALMGSAIAIREKSPTVAGTPSSEAELRRELREITRQLNVQARLASYHVIVEMAHSAPPPNKANYFLVELQPSINRVSVRPFKRGDVERATAEYLESEKKVLSAGGPGSQAVLVSVESMDLLKRAYPSYFLDAGRFIEAVEFAVK